jgi:hypothetical protein
MDGFGNWVFGNGFGNWVFGNEHKMIRMFGKL